MIDGGTITSVCVCVCVCVLERVVEGLLTACYSFHCGVGYGVWLHVCVCLCVYGGADGLGVWTDRNLPADKS